MPGLSCTCDRYQQEEQEQNSHENLPSPPAIECSRFILPKLTLYDFKQFPAEIEGNNEGPIQSGEHTYYLFGLTQGSVVQLTLRLLSK